MRTAARTDGNHKEIMAAFRKLGFSVKDVSQLKGFCDLAVARNNCTYLVEVKDGQKPPSKRRLTPEENEFHNNWNDKVYVIESLEDVIEFYKSTGGYQRGII